jgi:hypothetical protein
MADVNVAGIIAGTSGTVGDVGFLIPLAGSADGTASLSAELIAYFDGRNQINSTSNATGFLDIIPDFEATILFWRPQNNIIETLEWKTSVLKAYDGSEQRIKIRQSPRQHFKYEILLETNKLNSWWDSQIHNWQKSKWLIPIWPELEEHSVNINHHDTTIAVNTAYSDFRDNSKAIIWKSRTEYEVVVIDTVQDNQLNLGYSVLNTFIGTKYIIPIRESYVTASSDKQRFNSEVSRINLVFKIYDNTNLTGFVPVSNYDGFPVLEIPSFMNMTHGENSSPDMMVLDYETGIFKIANHTDFNYVTQQHKFINEGKAACWNFKKSLYSLNGKQKTVLIPTFRSDLTLSSDVYGSDNTIDIENIQLEDNMGLNNLRTYIGFYFPNTGQLIIRKITAITEIDASIEQITLDAAPQNQTIATNNNCRVCYVDKCRLNSDSLEIRWVKAHENECETQFARIS